MLRKGLSKDCNEIYNLICKLENTKLPLDKFYKIYNEQLSDKNYYCLVCECDNNLIGVLNLRFEKQLHHSEYIAEIMEFFIEPSYRKKGIGKEMFNSACQLAKNFGCTQIEVACDKNRTDSHRFYLRECMYNSHFKFSKPLA